MAALISTPPMVGVPFLPSIIASICAWSNLLVSPIFLLAARR